MRDRPSSVERTEIPPDEEIPQANRIEALGQTQRAGLFSGDLLLEAEDQTLQELVEQAAEACCAPIALVSLVLDRVQFFRAHYGLPPDLAVTRATDRDASFCQFVVRDRAAFETSQAGTDRRVPQELVKRYGIQSYLGMPVYVAGEPVGSLCVIDVEERPFDEGQRIAITKLASAASVRLDELARSTPTQTEFALAPAFAELRNAFAPMNAAIRGGRLTLAEIRPLARVRELIADGTCGSAVDVLRGAAEAVEDLESIFEDLEVCAARAAASVVALEAAITHATKSVFLGDVVEHSAELARHTLKLIGGVSCEPGEAFDATVAQRGASVVQLTAVLVAVAESLYEERWCEGVVLAGGNSRSEPAILVTLPVPEVSPRLVGLCQTRGPARVSVGRESVELRYAT